MVVKFFKFKRRYLIYIFLSLTFPIMTAEDLRTDARFLSLVDAAESAFLEEKSGSGSEAGLIKYSEPLLQEGQSGSFHGDNPSNFPVAAAKKRHRPLGFEDVKFIEIYIEKKGNKRKSPIDCPYGPCGELNSVADLDRHLRQKLGGKKTYICSCPHESFSTYASFKSHLGTDYHKINMAAKEQGSKKSRLLESEPPVVPGKASGLGPEASVINLPEPSLTDIYQELAGTVHRSLTISEYRIILDFYYVNGKNVRCPFCRRDFTGFSLFQDHFLEEGVLYPYYCKTCEKSFKEFNPFERHPGSERHIRKSAQRHREKSAQADEEEKYDDEV